MNDPSTPSIHHSSPKNLTTHHQQLPLNTAKRNSNINCRRISILAEQVSQIQVQSQLEEVKNKSESSLQLSIKALEEIKEEKHLHAIQILKEVPQDERTNEQLSFLAAHCQDQYKFFKDLQENHGADAVRRSVRYLKYMELQHDQVLFEQGDRGSNFYVILEGFVQILIKFPKVKIESNVRNQEEVAFETEKVNTITQGNYFGELVLINSDMLTRSATIKAGTHCKLGYMEKEDFLREIGVETTSKIKEQFEFVQSIGHFNMLSTRELLTFVYNFEEVAYKRGEIVYDSQNKDIEYVYFIKSGEFKLQCIYQTSLQLIRPQLLSASHKTKRFVQTIGIMVNKGTFGLEKFNQQLIKKEQGSDEVNRMGRVVCDSSPGIVLRVKASSIERIMWNEENMKSFQKIAKGLFLKQFQKLQQFLNIIKTQQQDLKARQEINCRMKYPIQYLGKNLQSQSPQFKKQQSISLQEINDQEEQQHKIQSFNCSLNNEVPLKSVRNIDSTEWNDTKEDLALKGEKESFLELFRYQNNKISNMCLGNDIISIGKSSNDCDYDKRVSQVYQNNIKEQQINFNRTSNIIKQSNGCFSRVKDYFALMPNGKDRIFQDLFIPPSQFALQIQDSSQPGESKNAHDTIYRKIRYKVRKIDASRQQEQNQQPQQPLQPQQKQQQQQSNEQRSPKKVLKIISLTPPNEVINNSQLLTISTVKQRNAIALKTEQDKINSQNTPISLTQSSSKSKFERSTPELIDISSIKKRFKSITNNRLKRTLQILPNSDNQFSNSVHDEGDQGIHIAPWTRPESTCDIQIDEIDFYEGRKCQTVDPSKKKRRKIFKSKQQEIHPLKKDNSYSPLKSSQEQSRRTSIVASNTTNYQDHNDSLSSKFFFSYGHYPSSFYQDNERKTNSSSKIFHTKSQSPSNNSRGIFQFSSVYLDSQNQKALISQDSTKSNRFNLSHSPKKISSCLTTSREVASSRSSTRKQRSLEGLFCEYNFLHHQKK